MKEFVPDYSLLVKSALNIQVERFPLYEHSVDPHVMEKILGIEFADLYNGNDADLDEFFRIYCGFFKQMGYDTVSFEELIGPAMPGSGALGNHTPGAIHTREDYDRYPWDEVVDNYFSLYSRSFTSLRKNLPDGMKAIGGAGYGIFECVQDVVGYENLCYMMVDDPLLYELMFEKVGSTNLAIWQRLLHEFGDVFCVCRFGDDLGFKSGTLISDTDIKQNIIPQYARIIEAIHAQHKPFLLHCCGCIFSVMEELITKAKIDAKHSNEDQIAPFSYWVETYGNRIGNFGGIDTDAVCQLGKTEMKEYISKVVGSSLGHGGFAFSSGNSIPDYVPADQYVQMNRIVRTIRGDFGRKMLREEIVHS
jgi:uroporphyrinogen decarboxylase